MPLRPQEFASRVALSIILAAINSGCIARSSAKDIFDPGASKQTVPTPELLYLYSSTPEDLVNAMGLTSENILLSLVNSDILYANQDTQLTNKQVGLLIENMRCLVSATSIENLGYYQRSFPNYLTFDADIHYLDLFTATSDTLIQVILQHWDDIDWFGNTYYQTIKGITNKIEADDKQQALYELIKALELYSTPLSERGDLSKISFSLDPEDSSKQNYPIETNIESLLDNLKSLRNKYEIHIVNGVPSA